MLQDKDWVEPGMRKFCVVANIVRERVDENGVLRHGTAAFPGGRKVYVSKTFSYNRDRIKVVGLNRFKKYVYDYVPFDAITNIRPDKTFSKTMISLMTDDVLDGICNEWFGYKEADRIATEIYANILNAAQNGNPELLEVFQNDFESHRWEYFNAFFQPRRVDKIEEWKGQKLSRRCPIPDLLTKIGMEEIEKRRQCKITERRKEMYRIESESFALELIPVVEGDEVSVTVKVRSDKFSAECTIDAFAGQIMIFAKDMLALYESLEGSARLEQDWSPNNYIQFSAQQHGHILVEGRLKSEARSGNVQEFSFKHVIDQSYIEGVAKELYADFGKNCQ